MTRFNMNSKKKQRQGRELGARLGSRGGGHLEGEGGEGKGEGGEGREGRLKVERILPGLHLTKG